MSCYDYLYYPYINFRSDVWLKKMALYADSVAHIVPHDYPTRPSDTVRFLEGEKFIASIPPYMAGPEPSQVFSEFLIDNQDRLKPRFEVHRENAWSSDPEDNHVLAEGQTRRAYVEASKLDGANLDALEAANLVVRGRWDEVEGDAFNWVGMHPLLANTYMTLLMNGIAKEEGALRPAADFATNAVDVHISTKEDLARLLLADAVPLDHAAVGDALVAFAFEQVLPADLDTLNIHDIWALRERFDGELGRFQKAVDRFARDHADLADIRNRDRFVKSLATKYKRDVQPALDDLQKAFGGIGKATVMSSMGITFAAPGLLTGLGIAFNPIAAGIAGGALAVAKILQAHDSDRDRVLRDCDYAWLYRVERELTAGSFIDDIARRATSLWH